MPTLIHLSRKTLNSNNEITTENKTLLLNLNAGLAMKLKGIGMDVFASLDNEDTRTWITSLIQGSEAVVEIAQVAWSRETDLEEYLDADGINAVREGFLTELENFSFQGSEKTLRVLVNEIKATATILDRERSERLPGAMEILRNKAVADIPEGENLAKELMREYEDYRRKSLGGSYTKE